MTKSEIKRLDIQSGKSHIATLHKCDCGKEHEYQDETYGDGNRVVVRMVSKTSNEICDRCTVCGKEWKTYENKRK